MLFQGRQLCQNCLSSILKKKKKKRASLRLIKFKSPLSSWHNRIKDTIKETQANNVDPD